MSTFLSLAGLGLQLVGGAVAFWGLVKTHDAYAEKTLRTLAGERLVGAGVRIWRWVRKVLGRPEHQIVYAGSAGGIGGAGSVRVTVTWGSLPPKTADALRELDRRTRDLSSRIDGLDHKIGDLTNEQAATLGDLRTELQKAQGESNALIRRAAIEGLMTEAIGLVLVTLGGIAQGWGSLAA